MRPAHLKSPFPWNERRVLIQDRIWYVPPLFDHYSAFAFPGWDHPEIFSNHQPVNIEYCSGNGAWIAQKALAHPEQNWVAVECKFPRVRKIWAKIQNHKIKNLLVVCGEGYFVTQQYLPAESVNSIFVNFPDPWPKTRHIKHRIIQPEFLTEMGRILKPKGTFTFVTDDDNYSDWTIQMTQKDPNLQNCDPSPYYRTEDPNYGTSYFEDLWREQGKTIRYHRFLKT